MSVKLKKIHDQVMVVTGASSGIGLTTVEMAAEAGARVMLSSRNENALRSAVARIKSRGGRASFFVADVADEAAMEALARQTVEEFGRIDTWVNNAGVSIYGKLEDTPTEDKRRLFDVNFWGIVNGCKAAVPHLKKTGGAIINVGSIVSDMAIPLQGIYSASKHAVKGYTDALRMELEQEGAPIAVTLVKPAAINTMYAEHARSHMAEEPALPPPLYEPEVVARAILRCAEKWTRDITVGGVGRAQTLFRAMAPRLADVYMERMMFSQQKAPEPSHGADSLYEPTADGRRRGRYAGRTLKTSAYTTAALSDVARAMPFIAATAGLAALLSRRRPRVSGARA